MVEEIKRGRGRPRKDESRVADPQTRPKRTPVSGNRDILTVLGKDPEYEYRWIADYSEDGQRIWRFMQAGYTFVSANTVEVGQSHVYQSENVGSIVRRPAGKTGDFLYLMKIPKEFYNEDQAAKQAEIDSVERSMQRRRKAQDAGDDGEYEDTKITRK
jgi:hypothetical protein